MLALWTLLSSTWGIAGTAAGFEAERTLFYAIALSALLVLCDGGWAGLLTGVLAGIAAVCVVALALAAGGFVERDPFEGTLLHEPVGYANALGIVAAMGVLLGAGKALERGPRHMRALAASAVVVAGVALVLTESRGAWLALACGAGVLVALRAPRPFAWAVPLDQPRPPCWPHRLPRSGTGRRTGGQRWTTRTRLRSWDRAPAASTTTGVRTGRSP